MKIYYFSVTLRVDYGFPRHADGYLIAENEEEAKDKIRKEYYGRAYDVYLEEKNLVERTVR